MPIAPSRKSCFCGSSSGNAATPLAIGIDRVPARNPRKPCASTPSFCISHSDFGLPSSPSIMAAAPVTTGAPRILPTSTMSQPRALKKSPVVLIGGASSPGVGVRYFVAKERIASGRFGCSTLGLYGSVVSDGTPYPGQRPKLLLMSSSVYPAFRAASCIPPTAALISSRW